MFLEDVMKLYIQINFRFSYENIFNIIYIQAIKVVRSCAAAQAYAPWIFPFKITMDDSPPKKGANNY